MNVLDLNGLTRLVNNIKNMFATKTELATKQDTLTNMTASEATTGTATTARTITAKVLNDKIDEKIAEVDTGVMSVTSSTNGKILVDGASVTAYTHPTTAGNKHIPTGGSTGQVLKYGGSSGTATWYTLTASDVGAAPSNIDTGVMSVSEGSTNGTISVDGTDVSVHGLGTGAYAEQYTHPTSAGNKHIPSGGSSGQVLVYGGSSGTASWTTLTASDVGAAASDINTGVMSVTAGSTNGKISVDGTDVTAYTHPTTAGNKHIPSGGSTGQILKYSAAGTATWANEYSYTHPSDGANTGNFGPSADASPDHSGTFSVPYFTVNSAGHVTAASTKTITLPAQYIHPTTAGNKHIPSGGSTGQFLKYSSSGTAAWSSITTSNITDFPTIPTITDTYDGTSSNGMSGKAVKSAIDSALTSAYKPSGSVAYASLPTLSASVMGNVYNVSDSFTIDNRFVEYDSGTTKTFPAGTEVAVINTGTTNSPTYKFSVMSGFIDLSGYQLTNTAVTHTQNTAAGSSTKPVYINSSGVATAVTYELNADVPSDAVFTDTVYTHPTTSGNKHIPSGGSSGQILKWSSDGTATWAAEYSYTHPTSAGNKHIPTGGSTGQVLKYGGSSGTASWATLTASDVGAAPSTIDTGVMSVIASSTNGKVSVDGTDVTVYTHPTTAGNKHIPSGGSSGQVLVYGGSSGTASWGSITAIVISDDTTMPNSVANGGVWYQLTGDSSITNGEQEQF